MVDMVLNSNMPNPHTDNLSMAADTLRKAMGPGRAMDLPLVPTVEDMAADTEVDISSSSRLGDKVLVQVVRQRWVWVAVF